MNGVGDGLGTGSGSGTGVGVTEGAGLGDGVGVGVACPLMQSAGRAAFADESERGSTKANKTSNVSSIVRTYFIPASFVFVFSLRAILPTATIIIETRPQSVALEYTIRQRMSVSGAHADAHSRKSLKN